MTRLFRFLVLPAAAVALFLAPALSSGQEQTSRDSAALLSEWQTLHNRLAEVAQTDLLLYSRVDDVAECVTRSATTDLVNAGRVWEATYRYMECVHIFGYIGSGTDPPVFQVFVTQYVQEVSYILVEGDIVMDAHNRDPRIMRLNIGMLKGLFFVASEGDWTP